MKKHEMQKFSKAQHSGTVFQFKLSNPALKLPDIPYNVDDALFEKDHPELYLEMLSRDLTLDDIRYILTRKQGGFSKGEIHESDLVNNTYAITKMYQYLSDLEKAGEL